MIFNEPGIADNLALDKLACFESEYILIKFGSNSAGEVYIRAYTYGEEIIEPEPEPEP